MTYKKYIPYFFAIALFAIINIIEFSPIFSGKALMQGDIVRYKGMSQEAVDFRNTQHSEALWTNSMFGGMPAYQISTQYPGNWLNKIDRFFHIYLPHPSGNVFLYFLGFFILLLCLEINPWLAIVGALAYGFSSYFYIILEAGHNSKANAIGYLAPTLGGLVLLFRGKNWLGFAVTLLFMALELNANHVQISYYGFMLFGFVVLSYGFYAFKQKNLKPFFLATVLFISATIVSVLPNAGNLLATYEYGNYTIRGKSELTIDANGKSKQNVSTSGLDKDYATQWSYGVGETGTLLIPNFKGGASAAIGRVDKTALKNVNREMKEQISGSNAYFGTQPFTSGPVYIGSIIILLAFLGLFIIDHPIKWALFAVTILSIALSWGKNFMGLTSLFMDLMPGYNKFRAVSMILVIAELTIPLLAVLAIDKFIKLTENGDLIKLPFVNQLVDLKKVFIISVAVIGGFCLISSLFPSITNSFIPEGEETQIANELGQSGASATQISSIMPELLSNLTIAREAIFKSDARRSLIFIGLAALFLFFFLIKKLSKELLFVSLAIFIVADLWPVANRYLNAENFVSKSMYNAPPQKTPADEVLLNDKTLDFRVLNLSVSPFNDATTSYYHKSIGGYHGAKLRKYQEIIDHHLDGEIKTFYDEINNAAQSDSLLQILTAKLGVLNMLNTKYILLPTKDAIIPVENKTANGNAWFIKNVKVVSSPDSEIVGLHSINTKRDIIVQQKNKELATVADSYNNTGKISLESYKPNDLVYQADAKEKGFAVFSEIYYPKGWNAYIDDQLTPHTCVNYILRGLEIPAGKHKIEFKFEPSIYKTGNTIAYIGSMFVLLGVFGGFYFAYKKKELVF